MYRIVKKRALNAFVTLMEVEAPYIARKARAGQFIILRVNEEGERIPLTIADHDENKGTVTIMFQKVGKTTLLLDTLEEGDAILDFVGPLGRATAGWRWWAAAWAAPSLIRRPRHSMRRAPGWI